MEKTIMIDGREVRLRASAAIPRLYRIKFRRDILQDMQTIKKAVEKSVQENAQEGGQMSSIPLEALELFENVSYLMAKHADPAVPPTVEAHQAPSRTSRPQRETPRWCPWSTLTPWSNGWRRTTSAVRPSRLRR